MIIPGARSGNMHEASIAMSILEIAFTEMESAGYVRVDSVDVRIGAAAGIMVDSLLFAFDAAKLDSPAHGAVINITHVPIKGDCKACGKGFASYEPYVLYCPVCDSAELRIESGRELDITSIEVS